MSLLERLGSGVLGAPSFAGAPWLAAGLAGAALTGLGVAVLHPRVEVFGPVIWSGPRDGNAVALTFDDGPHPRFTAQIAKALSRVNAHATFFCLGLAVERHPGLTRELVAAGHQLGNHTYRHGLGLDLFSKARLTEDVRRCQEVLAPILGHPPAYFRPAVGVRNPAVHAAARANGLRVVTWSRAARDGAWPLSERRARSLGRHSKPGDILTLHDGTVSVQEAVREGTAKNLPALLDELTGRGLRLLTVDELLAQRGTT